MQRNHTRWLNEQLPELVESGVLDPETAKRIAEHFATENAGWRREVVFAILGAVLLGGGVILLVAHNWQDLSRPARVVVAFAPLVGCQLLAAWVLRARSTSAAWREGVGGGLALAMASCLALVWQTYHIPDDFQNLLFYWLLLVVPIAYLLEARLPLLLYSFGTWTWLLQHDSAIDQGRQMLYWLFLALQLPFLWRSARSDKARSWITLLTWSAAISSYFGVGMTLDTQGSARLTLVLFGVLFAGHLALSKPWGESGRLRWGSPLRSSAVLGTVIVAITASYRDVWRNMPTLAEQLPTTGSWALALRVALLVVGLGATLWLLKSSDRRTVPADLSRLVVPVVALALAGGYLAASLGVDAFWIALIFNLLSACWALAAVLIGFRDGRASLVNGGLALASMLILLRFLDADLGLLPRALAFLAAGTAFLWANLALSRRSEVKS